MSADERLEEMAKMMEAGKLAVQSMLGGDWRKYDAGGGLTGLVLEAAKVPALLADLEALRERAEKAERELSQAVRALKLMNKHHASAEARVAHLEEELRKASA